MRDSLRRMGFERSSAVRRVALHASCAAFLVAVVAACSGTSGSGNNCSAGDVKSCTCADNSTGTQSCAADGSAYGACACSSADGGAGDSGGDSGAGDTGASDGPSAEGGLPFMAACTQVGTPGDCAAGLQCFNFTNRGPHCTHSCTSPADCAPPSPGCNGMGVCKAP